MAEDYLRSLCWPLLCETFLNKYLTLSAEMPLNNRLNHFLSPGKSDFLNFVRWAAALLVVVGHSDMYLQQFGGNFIRWDSFGGIHSVIFQHMRMLLSSSFLF